MITTYEFHRPARGEQNDVLVTAPRIPTELKKVKFEYFGREIEI
jgi:hypothetical protein